MVMYMSFANVIANMKTAIGSILRRVLVRIFNQPCHGLYGKGRQHWHVVTKLEITLRLNAMMTGTVNDNGKSLGHCS